MAKLFDRFHQMDRRQRQSFWINVGIAGGVFLIIIAVMASIKVRGYLVYENKEFGFRLSYPANWILYNKPEGGAEVVVTSPIESLDQFVENVSVDAQTLDRPTTLSAYSEKARHQLEITLEGAIKVVSTGSTSLSGLPAFRYIYEGNMVPGGDPIRFMHVWTVQGNRAYIITYTSQKSSYSKYFRDVDGMIRSFKIL